MTDQMWVLLWSKRQNCLHLEPVAKWLSKNRTAYRDDADLTDYHPLYIGDKATCEQTANAVRGTLREREAAHVAGLPTC